MICDEECRVWATQKLKLAPLVVEVPLPRRVCVYPEVRVASLRRAAKSGYVLGNLTSKVKSSCALSPGATPPGGATPPARAARLLARNSTERNKAARAVPRALLPLPGPSGSRFRSRPVENHPSVVYRYKLAVVHIWADLHSHLLIDPCIGGVLLRHENLPMLANMVQG